MTPLPRRQFIQGSALAAVLASVGACSTSRGDDDGPVTFEGTGPITWVQGKDNSGGKVQARLDEWNKAHPGEEVKLIELSAEADQQRTSFINAVRINSNAYDVVSLDNVWVSEFAANRWVVELPEDELKNDNILEPVWKTGLYKDRLFAVPHATDAPVMFYRKDFLAQAGVEVPTTWDEVKAAIDKVRALPEHKNIGGFGGQFAKYEGLTCESIAFDLHDKNSVHGAVDAVMQSARKVDVLINNAAYGCVKPLHEYEEEEWLEGIDGTINGVFRMTREILPVMLDQGHGNIINIASMYGMVAPNMEIYGDSGQNNPANYGAGKAAIIQFTKYIACVYAEKGVRANTVSPGPFPDPGVQKNVQFIRALENKTPMHRIGTPEDLQGIIVYLASDASRYTNGQNIAVDGGWTSW